MSKNSAKTRMFVPVTDSRPDWYCRATISKGRVAGTMYKGSGFVRMFDVALRTDKTIRVDIGTGSGIKIVFAEQK